MQQPPIRRFTLPPGLEPDKLKPASIVHGCDYLLRDDGTFEFFYNYLDYFWRIDGTDVRARHYLDRCSPPSVSVMMSFEQFDQPKFVSVLAYLQRRYGVIKTFESKGYVVRWTLENARPIVDKGASQKRR